MRQPFRFDHTWQLDAPRGRVFEALADVERYVAWWPQVRGIRRVDDSSGWATVRSMLPYSLDLLLRRQVEDRADGHLRVSIDGDLRGWSSWQLRTNGDETVAHYAQEVTVSSAALNVLPALSRPVLRANHTWMMRSGHRGLAAYLA